MARTMSSVRRGAAELVAPARATPHEFKPLSDIDDQEGLRFYRSGLFLYRRRAAMDGVDPAAVLRAALAEALVHYYPLAGRIVEASPGRKLLVECTGEGAVFVAAESGVAMDELGEVTGPPVPRHEELLCAADGAYADGGVVGRPLLYFQVTRMRCGGFVWGLQICHCLADAAGVAQFMTAVGEFARGVPGAPTVKPVWARELLSARRPPLPRDVAAPRHPEYEAVPDAGRDKVSHSDALVHRPFFFSRREIAAPARARAAVAGLPELAARAMEEGHLQSVADLMAARGRPRFAVARTYVVSDLTRSGLDGVDVGWGAPAYGGPATATLATFHVAGRRSGDGEEGVEVPIRLPAPAMERMVVEVARELGGVDAHTEACLAARL
ncbi:hypothetical protein OsJ_17179 [Oryza sativa Japonica Group]|uniref:Uncharacterized protein n=1 Tax=Oryza sativa subsp. japonica TaxID=39947 RepID=B9FMJ9_ORYSJ|nr:hypothetical protein OsJ_17179 [Oryza sativa Japonica Group]